VSVRFDRVGDRLCDQLGTGHVAARTQLHDRLLPALPELEIRTGLVMVVDEVGAEVRAEMPDLDVQRFAQATIAVADA